MKGAFEKLKNNLKYLRQLLFGAVTLIHFAAWAADPSLELRAAEKMRQANTPINVCDDFARFACEVMEHDDGTGTNYRRIQATPGYKEQRDIFRSESREGLKKDLSDRAYRGLVTRAFQLSSSPVCKTTDSSACLEILGDKLLALSRYRINRDFFNGPETSDENRAKLGEEADAEALDQVLSSQRFQKTQDMIERRFLERFSHPERAAHVRDFIFPEVKKRLVAKIDSSVTDTKLRQTLIEKVSRVQWAGTDCREHYALFINNAYYDAAAQTPQFFYCLGFTATIGSDFTEFFVVAHELSHAIDPCNIERGTGFLYKNRSIEGYEKSLEENPFGSVLTCLNEIKTKDYFDLPGHDSILIWLGDLISSVNKNIKKVLPVCLTELGEMFPDWMATELTADYFQNRRFSTEQYRAGFANVLSFGCGTTRGFLDDHPSAEFRYNDVISANPKIREMINCGGGVPGARYCAPVKPSAIAKPVKSTSAEK